jgi:hypothetical protein
MVLAVRDGRIGARAASNSTLFRGRIRRLLALTIPQIFEMNEPNRS